MRSDAKEAVATRAQRLRPAASTDYVVVATKLHIPTPRPERVVRDALLARLCDGRRAKLVLVSAPAGAGKTTLLSSWHAFAGEERAFAWVSLDESDHDPVRFWGCVLAALRTVEPGIGADVDAALRAPGIDVAELAVPLLVNALADLPRPLVLVLDDYHLIENPDVHGSVEFLLDHLPPSLQLAIATRSDPPFPLARYRATANLLEMRAADLSLTDAEAAAFLNGALRLGLSARQIARLQARTEGWAAGLQLVGLSLQGRGDRDAYIASFAGDDRQIVDYLAAEVLDRQPPATRRFLLQTSILDRLSGALCDAVVEAGGSAELLADVERANLFVIPLDAHRRWYRYHHLFGELLRHELRLTQPQLVPALHRRASQWYGAEGFIPEAIHHAIAAGDTDRAAELISANWLTYANRGELDTVEAWTRALPPGAAEADPRLCLARAWMLLVLGRPDDVEPQVRAAERGMPKGPMRDGSRSVQASAAMVRTSARLLLGDVAGASETARRAAELEPRLDAPWRPIVTNAIGMTAYWSGAAEEAVAAFHETVASGERVGNHTARIYALGYLAEIHAEQDDVEEAQRLVDCACSLARRQQLAEHWVVIMARYAAASLARRRRDLADGRAAATRGLELARRGGLRLDTVHGLLLLARLADDEGRTAEARESLRRARRQIAACPSPGMLAWRVEDLARSLHRGAAPGEIEAPVRDSSIVDDLSERELSVLRLLPTELSLREIGGELYVSPNTVKTHVRNIYAKLRVRSRGEAVRRARELRLG